MQSRLFVAASTDALTRTPRLPRLLRAGAELVPVAACAPPGGPARSTPCPSTTSPATSPTSQIAEHAPEMGEKFFEWYGSVFQDGALTAREKSPIALAVAHAVQCPYCIDAYTKDTLEKGCDVEQPPRPSTSRRPSRGARRSSTGSDEKVADSLGM